MSEGVLFYWDPLVCPNRMRQRNHAVASPPSSAPVSPNIPIAINESVALHSEAEMLVAEFRTASSTRAEELGSAVQPLFRHAGIRRHQTPVWQIDLAGAPIREDDLSAVVWIPVGVAQLGDQRQRRAWKLVAVPAGTSRSFSVGGEFAALAAARLEWTLGELYGDLEIDHDGGILRYLLPGLGVSIELAVAEAPAGGDGEIHADRDLVAGPPESRAVDLAFLGDLRREFFAARLGVGELAHQDWLALLNMTTTLLMRAEPVNSKELLGQWATPESARGAELIGMLAQVFADALEGDAAGWLLSNVRLDLFWIEELLDEFAVEQDPQWRGALADFFVRKFRAESLRWLFSLGAMDPRMRSADAVALERLAVRVLGEAVDLLSPGADGTLAENLALIASAIGKG